MAMMTDWGNEDTEELSVEENRRIRPPDTTTYELAWVEEEGVGMVLRVCRLGTAPVSPTRR